jgi:hypothetical protein
MAGRAMIELLDSAPDVDVAPAEYRRLLGYPPHAEMSERAAELAAWTRQWYAEHGRPWVFAHEAASVEIGDGAVSIDGVAFHSRRLREMIECAGGHSAVLVAVAAGPEIEQEAQCRWQEGKPDEYFFLEMYGSAVVEHLTTRIGARLCEWADACEMAVLPHYSPGYPEWEIGEQVALLEVLGRGRHLPGELEALASGALRPQKSQLAVFGLTRHRERVRRLTDLIPCENCSYPGCQFRRVPYRRGPGAQYTVRIAALKRWAAERLSLTRHPDGTFNAVFRYDGTTCTNMGRSLVFHYHVGLGTREHGYPILTQRCVPAPEDQGHAHMCEYVRDSRTLMAAIASEHPLAGQPLQAVLSWKRPASVAGCYCESDSREHKWGLVLETLHYALAELEHENQIV